MECSNCGEVYKKSTKSYKRKSIFLVKEKEYIEDVIGTRITPVMGRNSIFVCHKCFKLLQAACVGESAKRELFGRTKSGSYISVKRKLVTELHTPEKKMKLSSMSDSTLNTPQSTLPVSASTLNTLQSTLPVSASTLNTPQSTSKFKQARMSSGLNYLNNSRFKCGFRWFIKNSKAARRALHDILLKTSRKEVWAMLGHLLPITKDTSFDSYSNIDWETLTSLTQTHAPVLYNVLVGAMTYPGKEHSLVRGQTRSSLSLKPVMGCIISQILAQVKPKKIESLQNDEQLANAESWLQAIKRKSR